jgi:gluconate 5-dehydrogenase
MFSLNDKTAIVTGAGGYFGKAFTEGLLGAGCKVVLFGRGDKIKNLSKQFSNEYGNDKVHCCQVDFYDEERYNSLLIETILKNKTVDILVNNSYDFSKDTGFNDLSGRIENMSKEQWQKSFESGVYWHALATKVVGEKMRDQRSGSIINISSIYGVVSPDPNLYDRTELFNPPGYSAAKSALLAFTRYTASFYGKYNVRCNAIVPGAFPNMDPNVFNAPKDDFFIDRLKEKTVLKRVGKVEDLIGALLFLASDSSSYITGQSIIIDGGWTIT